MMRQERGAVALLTTIIIGILLAIITTGLVGLMVSELRQAEDSEQSVRSYYAAQSGVEDGIQKVIAALAAGTFTDQTCASPGSSNTDLLATSPGAVGWTCQQITYSGTPSGSIPRPDKAVQVDPGVVTGYGSVRLEWDTSVGKPASFYQAPSGNFPVNGAWSWAAPVELTVVEYPQTTFNAATAGQVAIHNYLVTPSTAGGGVINYISGPGGAVTSQGRCVPGAASYHCSVVLNSLANNRYYMFRLRTRYVGTDYRMTFYQSSGGAGPVVKVPDGTATIDVTAKAGDAFRRVVYKVPYQNSSASGLNFVIYSDTDVCKNFTVLLGDPQAGGCPY